MWWEDGTGKEGKGNSSTKEEEEGITEDEVFGQWESRSQGWGSVGGGSTRPSSMKTNVIVHCPRMKVWQIWRERRDTDLHEHDFLPEMLVDVELIVYFLHQDAPVSTHTDAVVQRHLVDPAEYVLRQVHRQLSHEVLVSRYSRVCLLGCRNHHTSWVQFTQVHARTVIPGVIVDYPPPRGGDELLAVWAEKCGFVKTGVHGTSRDEQLQLWMLCSGKGIAGRCKRWLVRCCNTQFKGIAARRKRWWLVRHGNTQFSTVPNESVIPRMALLSIVSFIAINHRHQYDPQGNSRAQFSRKIWLQMWTREILYYNTGH